MASRNLALGKGEVYFAQFKPGTQIPGGERFLGNCPEFTMNREAEKIEHFSSTRGMRLKDDEDTVGVNNTASISCDDVSPANLALWFLGEALTLTVSAAPDQGDTFEDVAPGLSYQLGVSDASPTGARKVSNVVVSKGVTPLTLGVDYDVDPVLGRITLLDSDDTTVVSGDDLTVAYDIDASTRSQIISTSASVEGALRFISYNPKGQRIDYFMPWVKFSPNGDIALITEEYMTIPLNVEALIKGDLEAIYADGRPLAA